MRLIHIVKKNDFDRSRKGTNMPTEKELKEGYLFQNHGHFNYVPDVTIIIGSDGFGSHASILLCRFHKLSPSLTKAQKQSLFMEAWSSLKRSKYESTRSGGSSGLTEKNNYFQTFLSEPGICPRNSKGSVWIRGRHDWFLYYIGTFDGKLKKFKYTNPVPGGTFLFKQSAIIENPFLHDFMKARPLTALLIEWIQPRVTNKEGFGVQITPHAVAAELLHLKETLTHLSDSIAGIPLDLTPSRQRVPSDLREMSRKHAFFFLYCRNHVRYTLVCHPVGFHLDYFAENVPKLENKVCFKLPLACLPHGKLSDSHPYGRGGDPSTSQFVYAILDW